MNEEYLFEKVDDEFCREIKQHLNLSESAWITIEEDMKNFYNSEENDGCDITKVTLYTFGSDDVIDYILSLGSDVQVLGPSDILDLIRNKVMSMCQNYFEVI